MGTKPVSTRVLKEVPVLSQPVALTGVVKAEDRNPHWHQIWETREKQYKDAFGGGFPKGKVLNVEGAYLAAKAGAEEGFCVMQYAPRSQRMSWIYLTHGLSQATFAGGHNASRVELALHMKSNDKQAPVQVLVRIAQQMLDAGTPLVPGQIVSSPLSGTSGVGLLEHWLVCEPDKTIPAQLELPRHQTRILLLVGISAAELDTTLKVKSELADGRRVLTEALQIGGVFPVTDPNRGCMTRRRDFHRFWESAFQKIQRKR